jgi:hypothetical protein
MYNCFFLKYILLDMKLIFLDIDCHKPDAPCLIQLTN